MTLSGAFLLDSAVFSIWLAARADGSLGSGSASDPYNATTRRDSEMQIVLDFDDINDLRKAVAITPVPHNFSNGDIIEISGVEGGSADRWNGMFVIYDAIGTTFKYYMRRPIAEVPEGQAICARVTFPFDEVMQTIPAKTRIHMGPGTFQTRGFAQGDQRGFQAKPGWNLVGSGIDVTVLQLVGADKADEHYHAIGMSIEPIGSAPIVPLDQFEISDLTIDCNVDNQPIRFD